VAQLEERPSVSKTLSIHGFHKNAGRFGDLAPYGSDAPFIQDVLREDERFKAQLHPEMNIRAAEVIWAVRHEMARTVEDFLSRRTRALLLDARTSMAIAPQVAALMAETLKRDANWESAQVAAYNQLAQGYLVA
jgi:glycerol-3-phosphate dehydrogenase